MPASDCRLTSSALVNSLLITRKLTFGPLTLVTLLSDYYTFRECQVTLKTVPELPKLLFHFCLKMVVSEMKVNYQPRIRLK